MSGGRGGDARDWLILLRAPTLGGGRIRELVERFGSVGAVCAAGAGALRAAGLAQAAIDWLARPDEARIEADLDWLAAPGHHLVPCDSPDFPALLARAPSPPAALYVVGDPDLLWTAQVAVVGSRNPTAGGRDHARDFAAAFARAGLTVTSGLAEGVDAAAHAAALDAGAPTIAVIGTGPDRAYPASNRALMRRIAEGGAIVTEFPPGTGPKRDHFPRRNRIIAGLSLGTLVVEAGVRSGALISARLASEAGREVFAIPGSIHNPLARGCHRLIRQGAALVETSGEVLEALAPVARELASALRQRLELAVPGPGGSPAQATDPEEDPDYARLWEALGHDAVGIDDLARRTGLTVDALSSMLLLMELDGRVVAAHGRYARSGS